MAPRETPNRAKHAFSELNTRNRLDALDAAELLGMNLPPAVRAKVLCIFKRNVAALEYGLLCRVDDYAAADEVWMDAARELIIREREGANR